MSEKPFITIITPSHDPVHLQEAWESLKAQTLKSGWEWLILLNGPAADVELNQSVFGDPRIRVIRYKGENTNIGFLKRRLCSAADGGIIIELDHDDMLTPDAVERINEVFDLHPEVGFVYSDNAKLAKNFTPYNPEHGWKHSKYNWKGKELTRMHSLPLTPGNLSYIWWSPDHVRAWRYDVYEKVGGHDTNLSVGDDHDLICRLYLETEFYHIDDVLYIYRIHDKNDGTKGRNTWIERNQLVQQQTHINHDKYIYALAKKWAGDDPCIDLCGAHDCPEGYTSIDNDLDGEPDILHDLNHPLPFIDNSIAVIRAHDALEHVENSIGLMHEIYRVLKPGGILLSLTPSTDGRGAFQDPTHVSFWNENSFWYWTRKQQAKYIGNDKSLFRPIKISTLFPSDWHKQHHISYVVARLEKPHG